MPSDKPVSKASENRRVSNEYILYSLIYYQFACACVRRSNLTCEELRLCDW